MKITKEFRRISKKNKNISIDKIRQIVLNYIIKIKNQRRKK